MADGPQKAEPVAPARTIDPQRPGMIDALGSRLRGKWPFIIAVTAVLFLVLVPLLQLVMTSARLGNPGRLKGWTLSHYEQAFSSSQTYQALFNTFAVAAASTLVSLTLAVLFAWLIERTDLPLRNLAWTILLLPMAVPGILFVLAWSLMLGPQGGVVNVAIRDVLSVVGIDLESGPFNIFSLGGLIFVDSMRSVTTIFLMLVGAFRLFDPALEEAAKVGGAGTFGTLRRVTLPALLPILAAAGMYAFIGNMESFESALVIGLPGGVFLLSTLIYFTVEMRMPINYGLGAVYGVLFMVLMALLVWGYRRIVRRSERFVTVTGKGYRPRRIELGRWRYPALALVLVFAVITVVLPVIVIAWVAVLPAYSGLLLTTSQNFTWDNITRLFQSGSGLGTIAWNTTVMTIGTATVTMILAFITSWAIVRGRGRGRGFLDGLSFMPYAFPGITIAIAFLFVFLNPPLNVLPVYGTVVILIIGLTTHYLAFGTRLMNSSVIQIQPELEEAGRASGAASFAVMRRITLPLLFPAFVAGWVWVAAHAIRAFSIPLVLASGQNEVFASGIYAEWAVGDRHDAAAMGLVLMVVLFPLTLFMRKLIVRISSAG